MSDKKNSVCRIWEIELGDEIHLYCTECKSGILKDQAGSGFDYHKLDCTQYKNPAVIRDVKHSLICLNCNKSYVGPYKGECPFCRSEKYRGEW